MSFIKYQETINKIAELLGGQLDFKKVVARKANEIIKSQVEQSCGLSGYEEYRYLYPNHIYFASQEVFDLATERLLAAFSTSRKDHYVLAESVAIDGALTLRSNGEHCTAMLYERENVGFPILLVCKDRDKFRVFFTDDGTYIAEKHGNRPKRETVYVQSKEAIFDCMKKIAKESFKVNMLDVKAQKSS